MIRPFVAVLLALVSSVWRGTRHPARTDEAVRMHPHAVREASDVESQIAGRSQEFTTAVRRVSAILHELSRQRDIFRNTGDLLELYPTFACNMVAEDLNYILRLDSPDAAMLLDVVVTFYDAHESNRRAFARGGSRCVEPHWRSYFKRALVLNGRVSVSQFDILLLILDGTAAHLLDLPRALVHVARSCRGSLDSIRNEFNGIDPLVSQSVRWSIRDIRAALQITDTRLIERAMAAGAAYVIRERRRAWHIATKGLPVPTKDPQPVLSRRYLARPELQSVLKFIQFRYGASQSPFHS